LGEAEVGRSPAVASPNSGAGFARAVGGDGGQDDPIFNDQEEDRMPGRPITDQQHRYYMSLRKTHPQKTAAAMAGFSPSTGHRAEKDPRLPSERHRARRHGGGKPDPLADLWDKEIVPLLTNTPGLKPITVLEEMQRRHPERDLMVARRTLERRMRLWRAEHGAEREVIFRQTHEPGRQGMSDFFNARKLEVKIAGQPLDHLIYHFALVYSGWEHAEVVLGGESFAALSSGLQNAFWQLGGVPKEHRTDSLSAAFANIEPTAREDLRARYSTLCGDYATQPTRNNRGIAHENGSIESRHGHFGTRLDQALQLRGSRDFATLADYRAFVAHTVGQHNARHRDALRIEAPHLLPLPPRRSCDHDEATVHVTSSSGFSLRKVFYTVPSRLIGHSLKARIFDDRIELLLAGRHIETLPRGRAPKGGRGARTHVINYRHIIHSLRQKPGALADLVYRDQLFPRSEYRRCWDALEAVMPRPDACRLMVGLLWLAHDQACEADLAAALTALLDAGLMPDLQDLQARFQQPKAAPDDVPVDIPPTAAYDALLASREQAA
jgi:hypothetical protein